jgi:hypothetical protein
VLQVNFRSLDREVNMLDRFRIRYPTACLTAELMTIHDGLFVVKASIQVEGTILATGLSAALTIEQAEDRARFRAIEVLGLAEEASSAATPPIPRTHLPPQPSPPASPVGETNGSSLGSGIADLEVEQQPLSAIDLHPAKKSPAPRKAGVGEESPSAIDPHPIEKSPSPLTAALGEGSPTDDSDLMMKTTLEINRLDWTAQQGRSYLEATYQKRSRQQLTREELLDFLQYLESQPTPAVKAEEAKKT